MRGIFSNTYFAVQTITHEKEGELAQSFETSSLSAKRMNVQIEK
jgi:hypothetical protein